MRVAFYLRATIKNLRRSTQAWDSGSLFTKASGRAAEGSGNDPHNLIPIAETKRSVSISLNCSNC